jgi:trehalose/maltose hydrolase-like predicted phosphorylase
LLASDTTPSSSSGEGGKSPARTRWLDYAMTHFRGSYAPFIRPPFHDFSEKRTMNNTTFLTGSAGVAMAALYGFGGIRYDDRGIAAHPILPQNWTRLRIKGVHYRGKVYDLDTTPEAPGQLLQRG